MQNVKGNFSALFLTMIIMCAVFTVQTFGNDAPIASITGNFTGVAPASSLNFDGSASFDADDDAVIGFSWKVTRPKGSIATFTTDGATAVLTPDTCGTYTVSLTVTDKDGATGTASQEISCQNVAPLLGSISEQVVYRGSMVNLRVDAADQDGDALQYAWIVTGPEGDSVEITRSGNGSSFTAADLGIYPVQVSVSDGKAAPVTTSTSVVVTRSSSGAAAYLMYVSEVLANKGSSIFRNKKMPAAFGSIFSRAINAINAEHYSEALVMLTAGIMSKTDGVVVHGAVDTNDWITNEDVQKAIYPVLLQARADIETSLQK